MPRSRRSAPPRSFRPLRLAGLVLIGVAVIVGLVIGLSGGSSTQRGYDVSYPQCGTPLPSGVLFGIVGVNGGLANQANPCLAQELAWARAAPGQRRPNQPRLSLYIDTANPGPQASDWPRRGTTPAYGTCNAKLTDACSYLYGEARAADSARRALALDRAEARTAPWWLDVELMASWASTYQLNVAALQGFIAGLHLSGITGPVGVYSTAVQWHDLTGLSARTTPTAFNGAPADWIAGTTATLDEARRACERGGFSGMAPTLAQYQAGGHDADVRCPSGG